MNIIIILLIFLIISILLYFIFEKSSNVVYDDKTDNLMIQKIINDLNKIDSRSSNFNYFSSNESYTENKKNIYLCLRDENNNFYDYNMLIYVAIHELAHALSNSVDTKHETLEFNNNFNYLLNSARNKDIYNPHIPLVDAYCPLKK